MSSHRERSDSVVECLTWDRGAAGLSLTGITVLWSLSRTIYPSLVLVQTRKTHPCLTERLLMGRKESNQTNKLDWSLGPHLSFYRISFTVYRSTVGHNTIWWRLCVNDLELHISFGPTSHQENITFMDRSVCLIKVALQNISKQVPENTYHSHKLRLAYFWAQNCEYFLIHPFKHMFWVLKRTVSLRRFFWVPTTYVLVETVLLSTHNICFGWEIRKLIFNFAL